MKTQDLIMSIFRPYFYLYYPAVTYRKEIKIDLFQKKTYELYCVDPIFSHPTIFLLVFNISTLSLNLRMFYFYSPRVN